jgi:Putative DNA-binding domain
MNREALRQQMLLRVLWRDGSASALQGCARAPHEAGLAAYRANAGALAERALGAAYPTIAALVGEDAFAALARDFWRHHPPERGDLAEWGGALPGFIKRSAQLASEAYLADSARLDWLVHRAARAADAADVPVAYELLASVDPPRLVLRLTPGAALLVSAWPVVAIWQAHHDNAQTPDRFAPVREAFASNQADIAFVWREGFVVRVDRLDQGSAAFTRALLEGRPLADALDLSGPDFSFDSWLARAASSRWIDRIDTLEHTP